jgi:phosphoribosylcarboxyaminoimidazole (NCAIR) mutase
MATSDLGGLDSLLSMVQMPAEVEKDDVVMLQETWA